MVCWEKIKEFEKKLGRKLTEEEKKEIREKMHHVEISGEEKENDEESKMEAEIAA